MDEFNLAGDPMDTLFMCVCDTVCYTERHNDTEVYDLAALLEDEEKMASFLDKVNRWFDKIHPSLDYADAEKVRKLVEWMHDDDPDKMNPEIFW